VKRQGGGGCGCWRLRGRLLLAQLADELLLLLHDLQHLEQCSRCHVWSGGQRLLLLLLLQQQLLLLLLLLILIWRGCFRGRLGTAPSPWRYSFSLVEKKRVGIANPQTILISM
jgi:hypothetical protein